MSRLSVSQVRPSQQVMDELHKAVENRLQVSSLAPCPVEFTSAVVKMCASQSCGKCTPCRVGLFQLGNLIDSVLDGKAGKKQIDLIEKTARDIYLSADCAIGYEAAEIVLQAVKGFRDDFEAHASRGVCGYKQSDLVPCVSGCPANVDIPGYIALVEAGRNSDAVRLIRKDNPFPVACGLICEHPCELYCRRGMVDDALNIRGIKRYATENMENDFMPPKASPTGKKVAIVGGGPSGLTAAYYLVLMGHEVTLYEQRKQLGGMMRYGIPSYRLPRERLDEEIAWLVDKGIKVESGVSVGKDIPMDQLIKDNDAVYVAIGAHADRKLGIEGEDAKGVMSAVEMLRSIGDGEMPDFTGKDIVVVGGGNVAMDCARSSVRLGAKKVTIVYRRRIQDMTAQPEEVQGAIQEGCVLLELHAPVKVEKDADGNVASLQVQPQIIGGVKDGRPAPRNSQADPVSVPADRIIVAIGQAIDSKPFEAAGMPANRGRFQADVAGSFADMPGVYAGGDCVSGPKTVILAIAAGKVAAANIDEYLGYHHEVKLDVDLPPVEFKGKLSCARTNMPEREAAERCKDFKLMEKCFTDEEVMQEASRCLRCDHFGFGAVKGARIKTW